MMACLLLTGKVDAIFSNNSDFAAYCRNKCLCIKKYKLVVQTGKNNNEQCMNGETMARIIFSTGDKSIVAENVIALISRI